MPSSRLMFRYSMVVAFFSFLASLSGILVETTIAARLGLSRSSDTFYAAFTVPYATVNLIGATGQFTLVPFFSFLNAGRTEDALWHGFSYVINMVLLGASVIAGAGATLAPWIVRGIAPGFARSEVLEAAGLCQCLFLIVIPACVAEVFRSFLLSQHRFAVASGCTLVRNLTVMVFTILGFHRWGAYSIAFGYLAGVSLQLVAVAGQTLLSFSVRYSLVLVARGEVFHKVRSAGVAQVTGALGWQSVVIAERIIASFLPPGTLTALNYGMKIMSTMAELLSGSIGTAALPALSRAAAHADPEEEARTFRHMLEIGLTLIAPLTVFCLLLPRPIIRLAFERGNFNPAATSQMALVFFFYSLSLPLFAAFRFLIFWLFAHNQARAYLRLAGLRYALTVAFDLIYVFGLGTGAEGIPLGLFTGLGIVCAFAAADNAAGLRGVIDRSFALFTLKNLAGAALAAMGILALAAWLHRPQTSVQNLVYLLALCGTGSAMFLLGLMISGAFRLSQVVHPGHREKSGCGG